MNETVFAISVLETGGIGCCESCEKVGYSILSHSVISDFRPPSVAEFGEAGLRRLLASRGIGCYLSASDDPALGSLTVFQSSRVA